MAQNSPKSGLIQLSKPLGVIKLKIKKKRATMSPSLRSSNALKPINGPIQDGRGHALKRKNPFRCSPRKKANLASGGKTPECRLFSALDGLDENLQNAPTSTLEIAKEVSLQHESQKKSTTFEDDSELSEDVETAKDEMVGSETFPLDWSLKSKIRFTSPKSFNWCGTLKTLEEAEGLSNFVRCHASGHAKEFECVDALENAVDAYPSSFCSFTKVWMHPSLPWLELFPRKSVDGKAGSKRDVQISNEMASSLQRDWVSSFRSVFNLTRVGFCPYFYLVANQNTMLFQAAGMNREECMQVIITPTTKGFRDALRTEGINFTMPHLGDKKKRESGTESQDDESDEEEPGEDSDDEYGDKRDWLESMGLDKEQFPLLNPKTITPDQINNLRTIDQQPTSTVLVKGADTHALFNFLLNCKSLIANTGLLAQVPPTLLAPVAFDGAALKGLRVNQGILKHQQAKGMTQLYTMEISGPIMPGCVYELTQLLKASQKGHFKAIFSAHQPSVAFNVPSENMESGNKSMPRESHLEHSISQGQLKYYQEAEQLKGNCLKELNCKDGLFTWIT